MVSKKYHRVTTSYLQIVQKENDGTTWRNNSVQETSKKLVESNNGGVAELHGFGSEFAHVYLGFLVQQESNGGDHVYENFNFARNNTSFDSVLDSRNFIGGNS